MFIFLLFVGKKSFSLKKEKCFFNINGLKKKKIIKRSTILARAGDALGWGFNLVHCGGYNASQDPRLVAYFIYHGEGAERYDFNLEQFRKCGLEYSLFSGNYRHISKMRGLM